MEIWQIILICFAVSCLLFWIASYFIIAYIVYRITLVRTSPEKWSRECSIQDDDEQLLMYQQANAWLAPYLDRKTDVDIVNEGFHLFGEYLDFGFDKAVIIIAGRTEGCQYSYYFAEPYRRAGYNVLVIDNRAHGLSDGKYNALGLKEYSDIIAWGKFLHEQKNNNKIVLHGICIGSATALYTLISDRCPDYIVGMVADGMYSDFKETTKNHMIEQNRQVYPCLNLFMWFFKLCTKEDAVKNGPIQVMGRLKKPILFIYSKEDIYSVPEKGQLLYDTCQSEKRLVWFDKGGHSRVRINNQEKYDNTIVEYLEQTFNA
jgi:pimeloyl-ACP methyl ester carboxylesterase